MPSSTIPTSSQKLAAQPAAAKKSSNKRSASSSSAQRQLRTYERLLQGVATATHCLLTGQSHSASIDQALAILGEATLVDRIYIFENGPHPDTQEPAMSQRWEWVADGVTPELGNPELQNLMYRDAFPRWHGMLSNRHPIVGLIESFSQSEQAILVPQGILSILVVPILIQEQFWGFVGFDQCKVPYQWSEVEISTLWAIAGSFGGAIARHRAETALQTLNANLEQRIEDRTYELKKANTELSSTLQRLKETQSQLIHTEKMSSLCQLVAGIAHEINNPVSFIRGNLSPAQRYVVDLLKLVDAYQSAHPDKPDSVAELDIDTDFIREDFSLLMQSMCSGAERIADIVQSLRTFSRLDEAELKSVDIHRGIESTLSLLQHRLSPDADHSAIEVVRQYTQPPLLVECYPGSLNQVFMTLLINAIDAIERRERSHSAATIEIQTIPQIDDRIVIRISDNGAGIEDAIANKIFDPFFTTKPVGKGTGLGLSIAHQIIATQHNGTIQCRSQIGKGSTFTIEIPTTQSS